MAKKSNLAEREQEDAAIDAAMDDVMLSIHRILDQDSSSPKSSVAQNSNSVDSSTADRLAKNISADPALLAKVESHLHPVESDSGELKQTVERLLVPLLWEWLASNLPTIVDRIVREEVLGPPDDNADADKASGVKRNEKK